MLYSAGRQSLRPTGRRTGRIISYRYVSTTFKPVRRLKVEITCFPPAWWLIGVKYPGQSAVRRGFTPKARPTSTSSNPAFIETGGFKRKLCAIFFQISAIIFCYFCMFLYLLAIKHFIIHPSACNHDNSISTPVTQNGAFFTSDHVSSNQ